jgi:hypothetical protein
MKTLLAKLALLLTLPVCALTSLPLPAAADSTAGLILNTQCGDYHINIWRKYGSGELLYRSTSRYGDLNLDRGTIQLTEGVKVYRFQNGDYAYWVWDGTLDSSQSGNLNVYQNNYSLMELNCTKN